MNTCGFIRSAVEEGIDTILSLAEAKKADPTKRLVVTGCMVQRYGDDLQKELPEVDLFIGTDGFHEIASCLEQLEARQKAGPVLRRPPRFLMNSALPRRLSTPSHRAYMKITEGCANRCSYCLIPSLRGGLRSRCPEDLVHEARLMGAAGVKELTLVGQDLTAYGADLGSAGPRLLDLLEGLLDNSAIPWIRLLYLHPVRVNDELLDFMAAHPRIVPYLDIPLQHVSGRILQAMNRPHDPEKIKTLVARVREKLPGAAIRTTFMVGFPGETEADVDMLESFMRRFLLEHVGVFTYSDEEGCAACSLPDQVDEKIKIARRGRLMAVQSEISLARNKRLKGTVQEVLVEGISRETELLLEGRTRHQAPEVDGCVYITSGIARPGEMIKVRITEAHPYDLVGERIG